MSFRSLLHVAYGTRDVHICTATGRFCGDCTGSLCWLPCHACPPPCSDPSALLCVQSLPFSVLWTPLPRLLYGWDLGLTDITARQEIRLGAESSWGSLSSFLPARALRSAMAPLPGCPFSVLQSSPGCGITAAPPPLQGPRMLWLPGVAAL